VDPDLIRRPLVERPIARRPATALLRRPQQVGLAQKQNDVAVTAPEEAEEACDDEADPTPKWFTAIFNGLRLA
jgi:hypothetical protein